MTRAFSRFVAADFPVKGRGYARCAQGLDRECSVR